MVAKLELVLILYLKIKGGGGSVASSSLCNDKLVCAECTLNHLSECSYFTVVL
jgi:hypothetical protein